MNAPSDSTGAAAREHPVEPGRSAEIRRYHRRRLLLRLAELAVALAYLVAVVLTGAAGPVDRLARGVSTALVWRVAVVAAVIGAGEALLTFPLAWLRGFWLPRRVGLLHQPLSGWLADRAKAGLLGAALGLLALQVIYALLAAVPAWWLLAAGGIVGIQVLVTLVFPVWLLPLFYRLSPLDDAALRARLLDLAARAGVAAVNVCVADESRKSRGANAAVTGLGRTRRIVLFDTLLSRFAPAEIEAVLAHELGHHVHRDMWRGLALQAGLTVVALAAADALLGAGPRLFGLSSPADPAGIPWLLLVVTVLGLVATPLANAVSRRIERQADDFALDVTGDAASFVAAMEHLADLNLAERRPHPLKEALLYSHPSIERRIARARRRAAAAPGPAVAALALALLLGACAPNTPLPPPPPVAAGLPDLRGLWTGTWGGGPASLLVTDQSLTTEQRAVHFGSAPVLGERAPDLAAVLTSLIDGHQVSTNARGWFGLSGRGLVVLIRAESGHGIQELTLLPRTDGRLEGTGSSTFRWGPQGPVVLTRAAP